MKLHLDNPDSRNLVTGYGDDHVFISYRRHDTSLIVLPGEIVPWSAHCFDALDIRDFEQILPLAPEVLLIGTGRRLRFPSPALLRPLMEAHIGYEVMDLPAACRTFNILMGEGRRVAAALLIEHGLSPS